MCLSQGSSYESHTGGLESRAHGNATHLFDLDIESAAGGGPVRGGPSREVSDPQLELKRGP